VIKENRTLMTLAENLDEGFRHYRAKPFLREHFGGSGGSTRI